MCAVASAQKHPYLFFTKSRIDVLKERIKTDTSFTNNWNDLLTTTNSLLTKGDAKDKMDYFAIAWLVTNDTKYANKIKDLLINLCSKPTWANEEMLQRDPQWLSDLETARDCFDVAIGYDAIYDQLSTAEKKTIVEGVVRMGIKTALGEWLLPNTRIHTLNSMGHNWWSACVGSAGIASLAVKEEWPEGKAMAEAVGNGLKEWYLFNGDVLQNKPKTMDKDGGMYESVNYAMFGLQQFLLFRLAFADALPSQKQPVINGLEKIGDWFCQVSYPRTGELYSLNFGDDEVQTAAESVMKLLYALGYQNPNELWYISQVQKKQHRDIWYTNTPMGAILQPGMKQTPTEPALPNAALFEDMDWASLRSSWHKNATMLGVKSGYTWNHSHADANSFILFHKGENIIKDAGNSWYASKDYSAYFFQSEAHNVVLFNGKAQPKEQEYNGSPIRGQLSDLMDGGNIKYVLANGVGPTAANFTRNFRHFIWLGKVIIIVDDVKAHETGSFSWLLHPGGESKKIGGDISIVKNKAAILVRPLFPETLVQTGFDHDFPDKMKLEEITSPKARDPQNPTEIHYSISYPQQVKQTKFITAIILKDSVNDKNLPVIERLQSLTMNGVRIKQDGKVTELYLNLLADGHIMHLNSINNFNGWETDAYLFAITYPEKQTPATPNEVTDYFMAYGSYIRKDNQTVFSSLSKLNMIAGSNGNEWNMVLTGQPYINASFSMPKKPAVFNLNHQPVTPVYNNNALQIHIEKQ
ncbi:hypothetical protein F5148DRAFT_1289421 [Russula earlei]|uniref:Uncharacterized protein n=1 Tax=Russula earlei TaxID=71964 RepID=A0ACC0TZZ4_9AGAM|nr:hypothetical protein F5148DRAFT_1289421 [Russula earlei]